MTGTVLVYSGGLDSTTLLYDLRAQGHTLHALGVDYGQRHARELAAAARLAAAAGVPYRTVDLRALTPLLGGSSQTDPAVAVPLGHYADPTMRATVVPNRNLLLLSVAAAWAISQGAGAVAYAAHRGDHPVYPDCRPAFVDAARAVLALVHYTPVALLAPYLALTKADLVRRGTALGVPYGETWSCYVGGAVHCGACGTCVERRLAFIEAGTTDPTRYADPAPVAG
jgi:7-cyano-7-deazaguanine synthase